MNLFSAIAGAFKKLWKIIVSPAAQRAVETAVDLVPEVLPIVQDLRSIDPKTASVSDIYALYAKYKIPIQGLLQDPTAIGNALLNLATALVKRQQPNLATSLIQAAIQIALVALKA